jgi:MFS family permease
MTRVLSERDQLRALMLVAAACGANRVGAIVESYARYSELGGGFGHDPFSNHGLPIVGAFLAAALIHRRDARLTTILAAAVCGLGSLLSAVSLVWVGSVLSYAGTGAFTVGSFAFAAALLVPDEQHLSPSRFAGMAAFVFARVAMMDVGALAWSWVPYDVRGESRLAHAVGAALALASLLAVVFALPREKPESAAGPTQPVYRAASPIEEQAAPALPTPRKIWPAVRPLAAPTALFAFSTAVGRYRMGSDASNLFGGLTAIAGAIYFVRLWRRRSAVSVIEWYAHGLMVAAAGWLLLGLGMFVGILAYVGAIAAAVGGAVAGLSLGLVALAGRGPRAGVALACWLLLSAAAASVSETFTYGGGVLLLLATLLTFVVARGLKRRARELEAWF